MSRRGRSRPDDEANTEKTKTKDGERLILKGECKGGWMGGRKGGRKKKKERERGGSEGGNRIKWRRHSPTALI